MEGSSPEYAVDGIIKSGNHWWSDTDPDRHYIFEMPQWLQVDLGEEQTIDHVKAVFQWWEHESLLTRLRVYKYIVETSVDGEEWVTIIDESKNEDNVRPEGTQRWFAPLQARYVRITVQRNSAFGSPRTTHCGPP